MSERAFRSWNPPSTTTMIDLEEDENPYTVGYSPVPDKPPTPDKPGRKRGPFLSVGVGAGSTIGGAAPPKEEHNTEMTPVASISYTFNKYPKAGDAGDYYQNDDPPEQMASTSSIFLMIFINFLSNVVFSIVLPTLPHFLTKLGAPTYLNGYAVAVNSLGTFLASPIFGWWADKRNFREVFLLSLILMAASNIWYSLAPDVYQLLAARFVVGIAAANYAPANSYLSYATSSEDRAKVMTWNAASTVLGFICGPGFSLATSLLNFSWTIAGFTIKLNAETAPGWISAIFSIIGIFCLIPFKEVLRPVPTVILPPSRRLTPSSLKSWRTLSMVGQTNVPVRGVLVCLFFSFSFTTAFTIFETIGPLYTAKYYNFEDFQNSLLFLGISVGSLIALAFLQGLLLIVKDDRKLLVSFGFTLTAGLMLIFEWHNLWVSETRFYIGITLVALGFADGQAVLLALFSKLLEEQEQGIMMGWLSSSGSIARMLCPIAASYANNYYGPNYIFLVCSSLCFVACMTVIFAWKLLVPNHLY